jgi:hypothetical protein
MALLRRIQAGWSLCLTSTQLWRGPYSGNTAGQSSESATTLPPGLQTDICSVSESGWSVQWGGWRLLASLAAILSELGTARVGLLPPHSSDQQKHKA